MRAVVGRLTAANAIVAALGLLTGPLLARALGPGGRGDLAAILVPLGLLPALLGLGIPAYLYRELPRGRPPAVVLTSLAVPVTAVGAVMAVLAVPASRWLAGDRETVRLFLLMGFLLMPLSLVGRLLLPALASLERWERVVAATIIPFAVSAATIVVLFAAGRLTVAAAAAASIAGGLLALAPGLPLLWEGGRPRFERRVARDGVAFGAQSWLGGIAFLVNVRLDQFVMIGAVAPRELGLYAVAATLASASGIVTSGISPPLMTRVGAGETALVAQTVRLTLAATAIFNALLALFASLLLPLVFGADFRRAVGMTLVLLLANVFAAGCAVLSSGLQACGHPLVPSLGEGAAVVTTLVGLLLLLGPLGGVGAAIASTVAYATSFAIQLAAARRLVPGGGRYVVPTRRDLSVAAGQMQRKRTSSLRAVNKSVSTRQPGANNSSAVR
jgi:O-antigen/teichoic acid export membrane protein